MYRADIDGLRALAVISVIFYHLGVTGFSGGFVGVDVFFVISGFLITRLILADIEKDKFSFVRFYGRRARRLFPAFFFMLVVSSVFSYIMFTPEHFSRFSGAVVYALGSISNFYFLGESGYFDASVDIKPLLHTWTLGVEEQFYFMWPFLLVMLVKKGHKWAAPICIGIFGVISLYYSEKLLSTSPETAFYLVPFRVMEFSIGSVLVWFIGFQFKNKVITEMIPLLGLSIIGYSIYTYSNETLFPGVNALLPCIGAALVIYSKNSNMVCTALKNKAVVYIGLISYSLYLAHWPIIVFYKYYIFNTSSDLTELEMVSLVIATFVVAVFMYVYIETPFRGKKDGQQKLSIPAFGFVCALSSIVLMIPAASAWATGGWLWRYTDLSESARNELKIKDSDYREYAYKKIIELSEQPFFNNSKKKILVIGDSQAGDFVNMLVENNYHKKINLSAIVIGAKCQPLLLAEIEVAQYIGDKYKATCRAQREKYKKSVKLKQADVIVLAAAWRGWGVDKLGDTIQKLRSLGIKAIYVVGPKNQGKSGQALLARYKRSEGIEEISAQYIREGTVRMNKTLQSLYKDSFINLLSYICPDEAHCRVLTPNDKVIFFDQSHVSPEGARYLGGLLYNAGELSFLGR